MSDLFIPGRNPLAKALRGWPSSPDEQPKIRVKPKYGDGPRGFVYMPNAGGQFGSEIATGVLTEITAGSGNLVKDQRGLYLKCTNSIAEIDRDVNLWNGYCMTIAGKWSAVNSPWGGLYTLAQANNSNHIGLQRFNQNNWLTVFHGDTDNEPLRNISISTLTDGNYHVITVTWSPNSNVLTAYLDGSLVESVGYSKNPDGIASKIIIFGERNSDPDYGSDGEVLFLGAEAYRGNARALEVNKNVFAYVEAANQTPFMVQVPEAAPVTGQYAIPADHPLTRSLRGWPSSPGVKPAIPIEIDYSNRFAKGLLSFNYFDRYKAFDLHRPYITQDETDVTYNGRFGAFNGSSSYIDLKEPTAGGETSLTAFARFRLNSISRQRIITRWGANASYRQFVFSIRSTGEVDFGTYDDDGDAFIKYGDTTLTTGKWYAVAASWRQGELTCAINGVEEPLDNVGWVTGTVESLRTVTTRAYIGRQLSSPFEYLDGDIECAWISVAFHDFASLADLTANPYQIVTPSNDAPFIIGTAAAPEPAPILSNIEATGITQTSVTPQIDLTFP